MSSNSNSLLPKISILGVCYVVIGWLTVEFVHKKPFLSVFESPTPVFRQILFGAAAGIVLALIQIAWLRWWSWWRNLLAQIVGQNAGLYRAPVLTLFLISLIVGVTEEIAFRAAIQPLAGIWAASILFTVVHLNFDFSAFKKSDLPFAALSIGTVFAVSLAMGALFDRFGLLASMTAHILYDALVLLACRNLAASPVKLETDSTVKII